MNRIGPESRPGYSNFLKLLVQQTLRTRDAQHTLYHLKDAVLFSISIELEAEEFAVPPHQIAFIIITKLYLRILFCIRQLLECIR